MLSPLRPRLATILLLATLIPAALASVTQARAADPVPLETILQQNRSTLQWNDKDQLTGPAADRLLAEAKESQFFLIGEWHGGVEPPKLTSALFRAFAGLGYQHLAVELGPITTREIQTAAVRSAGIEPIVELSKRYPFALAFASWREEAELLYGAIHAFPDRRTDDSSRNSHTLWGLDQEFIFSGRLHFDHLAVLAGHEKNPAASAVLMEYRARVIAGETVPPPKENSAPPFLAVATPADFDKLAAAFTPGDDAQRTVAELRASAAIYQAWSQGDDGGYTANVARAALMQRHFNEYYDRSVALGEKTPRVLLKFGDTHMVRGRSFTNVFDLGTYLPALAAHNGLRTYHLLLVARGGHINGAVPGAPPEAAQSEYKATDTEEGFDPAPLFAAAPKDEWTLLDLRAVRPLLSAGKVKADEVMARMIWGFDGVLVIPESHASTTIK